MLEKGKSSVRDGYFARPFHPHLEVLRTNFKAARRSDRSNNDPDPALRDRSVRKDPGVREGFLGGFDSSPLLHLALDDLM